MSSSRFNTIRFMLFTAKSYRTIRYDLTLSISRIVLNRPNQEDSWKKSAVRIHRKTIIFFRAKTDD